MQIVAELLRMRWILIFDGGMMLGQIMGECKALWEKIFLGLIYSEFCVFGRRCQILLLEMLHGLRWWRAGER